MFLRRLVKVVNSRGQLVPAVSIPFACEEARQKRRPNSLRSQPRHVSKYIGSSQYSHSSSAAAALKGSSNYALSESKHCQCGCSGRCATCRDSAFKWPGRSDPFRAKPGALWCGGIRWGNLWKGQNCSCCSLRLQECQVKTGFIRPCGLFPSLLKHRKLPAKNNIVAGGSEVQAGSKFIKTSFSLYFHIKYEFIINCFWCGGKT